MKKYSLHELKTAAELFQTVRNLKSEDSPIYSSDGHLVVSGVFIDENLFNHLTMADVARIANIDLWPKASEIFSIIGEFCTDEFHVFSESGKYVVKDILLDDRQRISLKVVPSEAVDFGGAR